MKACLCVYSFVCALVVLGEDLAWQRDQCSTQTSGLPCSQGYRIRMARTGVPIETRQICRPPCKPEKSCCISWVCTIQMSMLGLFSRGGFVNEWPSSCAQSSGETEVTIVAQNKDCYESGIVCMKTLVIHVGLTEIYFMDNSGDPVNTHTNSY